MEIPGGAQIPPGMSVLRLEFPLCFGILMSVEMPQISSNGKYSSLRDLYYLFPEWVTFVKNRIFPFMKNV